MHLSTCLHDVGTSVTLLVMRHVVVEDKLVYKTQRTGGQQLKVEGLAVSLFNPDLFMEEGGGSSWQVEHAFISHLLSDAWSTYLARRGDNPTTARSKLQGVDDESTLVPSPENPECPLVAFGTESLEPDPTRGRGGAAKAAAEVEVACEICQQKVNTSFLRHHMSGHLNSPAPWPGTLTRPAEPCGLCGIRSAAGEHLVDTSITDRCAVSLAKPTGTVKAVHQCKLAGHVTYSLQSAGKSVMSAPSTNRPVKCPHNGCRLTVWSYSVTAHYEAKHPESCVPVSLIEETGRGEHEVEWCATLLGRRAVPHTYACKKFSDECSCEAARKRKRS